MATILSEGKRKIKVGISLSKEVVDRIDAERKDVPRSRFIERLIRNSFVQHLS